MNRFGGRATIAEVASRAGVSRTTVSHVLSGNRPVAAATRERVERAVHELGYRPDRVARSLRTKRSHAVALIIPDITNPYYPVLARGIEDGLAAAGYRTFVCNTDAVRERELEFLGDVAARRVDGIALSCFRIGAGDLDGLIDAGTPLVSIGARVEHPLVDVVMTDDERGAFDATTLLIEGGRTTVALIRGAEGTGQPRTEGYERALEGAAFPVDPRYMRPGDWTRQGGARAMEVLLSLDPVPTAVFCENDLMAIGAMDVVRARGLRIPDDLAIVGFDDIEAAALVTPGLTTVLNPAYETGEVVARLLLDRMRGYDGPGRTEILSCRLISRESC
jgi:LacI family transcriptional regulator